MDFVPISINSASANQAGSRSSDHLLAINPPGHSCLSRVARSYAGQHIASDFTKGASGLLTLVGSILLAVGTYENGIKDPGAMLGASVAGMGLTAWVTSTVLSASIRPEAESGCLHVGKSALTYLLGCCICCQLFCQ